MLHLLEEARSAILSYGKRVGSGKKFNWYGTAQPVSRRVSDSFLRRFVVADLQHLPQLERQERWDRAGLLCRGAESA